MPLADSVLAEVELPLHEQSTFEMNSPEGAVGWSCPPFSAAPPQPGVVAAVLQEQSSALVTLKTSATDLLRTVRFVESTKAQDG